MNLSYRGRTPRRRKERNRKQFNEALEERYVPTSNDDVNHPDFGIAVAGTESASGSSVVSALLGAFLAELPEYRPGHTRLGVGVINYSSRPWTAYAPFPLALQNLPNDEAMAGDFHQFSDYQRRIAERPNDIYYHKHALQSHGNPTNIGKYTVYNVRPFDFDLVRLLPNTVDDIAREIRSLHSLCISDCAMENEEAAISALSSSRVIIVVCHPSQRSVELALSKIEFMIKHLNIKPWQIVVAVNRYVSRRMRQLLTSIL